MRRPANTTGARGRSPSPDFSSYYQSGGCAVTSHARPTAAAPPPLLLRRATFVSVYSAVSAPPAAPPRCCCEQCDSAACPVHAPPPSAVYKENVKQFSESSTLTPAVVDVGTLCADPSCPAQTKNIPRCLFPPPPPPPQPYPVVAEEQYKEPPQPSPPAGKCSSRCAGQREPSEDSAPEEEEPNCSPTCRFYREPGEEEPDCSPTCRFYREPGEEEPDEPCTNIYPRRPRRKKKKKKVTPAPRCWSTPRRAGGTGGRPAACPQCAQLRHRELPYGPRAPSRYHENCKNEYTGPNTCALHGPGAAGGRRGRTPCPRPRECGRGHRRVVASRAEFDQYDSKSSKVCKCKRNRN